jgi:uncharacterized membrane protein
MLTKSLFFHMPSLCTQEQIYSVFIWHGFHVAAQMITQWFEAWGFMWPIYQSVVMVTIMYHMLKICGFLHNHENRRTSF